MITDLRNPCLKQRHWDLIEGVLEYKFTPEDPLTLGKLTDINAFKHAETLQEISGQASSEASLESILKKVGFFLAFVFCRFCVVIRFFSSPPQWPMTSDFEGFLYQILSIIFLS